MSTTIPKKFYIEPDDYERLVAIGKKRRRSVSFLVREAVEQFINQHEEASRHDQSEGD